MNRFSMDLFILLLYSLSLLIQIYIRCKYGLQTNLKIPVFGLFFWGGGSLGRFSFQLVVRKVVF